MSSLEDSKAPEITVAASFPAAVVSALPPSLCVLLAVLRTRAAQEVTRDYLHTPAMRHSLHSTFYHSGLARYWAQITAARSPLRIDDIDGRTVVAATPVSVAALRAMMDVFNLSHPCQVTLGLFLD